MSWLRRVAALMGISAVVAASTTPALGPSLDSPQVEAIRKRMGGQISPPLITRTRWHLADLEQAELLADAGDLSMAGSLMRSVRKDGTVAGMLGTRTGGLVRLPKKYRGEPEAVQALEIGHDSVRSVFEEMFPAAELKALAADGVLIGVGVGLLEPVVGRDYPVFIRLEPENLRYRWHENRWYYVTLIGQVPVEPGWGRWVLHMPGGRVAPWQHGLWRAVGQAWIDKQHARLHKANWEAKLANPARVAVSPQGAGEKQKQSWFRAVMAWGVNSVFGVTPGFDVKLLESNGRGYDCFIKTIAEANRDIIIAITGSTVLVDGGTGFANADVFAAIRFDLIQDDADALAYTLNTQGIPPWIVARWGEAGLERSALVSWDTTPPEARTKDSAAASQAATAITSLRAALDGTDVELDVRAFAIRNAIPLRAIAKGDPSNATSANDATRASDDDGSIDVDVDADMKEAA